MSIFLNDDKLFYVTIQHCLLRPASSKEAFEHFIHANIRHTSLPAVCLVGSSSYFIKNSVISILTSLLQEIFGPVLTAFVYPASEYKHYMELVRIDYCVVFVQTFVRSLLGAMRIMCRNMNTIICFSLD